MDVDIGAAVLTGLGSVGVIASGFALFQNYSHKTITETITVTPILFFAV